MGVDFEAPSSPNQRRGKVGVVHNLTLYREKEIFSLIKKLLPLSNHTEKTRKMKFILENKESDWKEVEPGWNKLRGEIEKELIKNKS